MAVVNTKSSVITNLDATPVVKCKPSLAGGELHELVGTVAVANGDSIGSTLRFGRIKSSARVSTIKLYCTAVTSAAMDVGIYRTAGDGGAVVDADLFASAQSIATAITTGTEIQHESAVTTVDELEKELWEMLGLTEDPNVFYDIVGTLTAAATAAGSVQLKVQYVAK